MPESGQTFVRHTCAYTLVGRHLSQVYARAFTDALRAVAYDEGQEYPSNTFSPVHRAEDGKVFVAKPPWTEFTAQEHSFLSVFFYTEGIPTRADEILVKRVDHLP